MRTLLILTVLMWLFSAGASCSTKKACNLGPIRIGILDTGFGFNDLGHDAPLCKYGHKDFSTDQKFTSAYDTKAPVPLDSHGHGTNVAGLIHEFASKGPNSYCFVIIKYWNSKQKGYESVAAAVAAMKYANNLKLEVINYSGGGPTENQEERNAVVQLLDRGALIIAAAGNEKQYLDGVTNAYFPAMYDRRITIVGNKDFYGNKEPSSNYGPYVTTWENGVNQTAYGITMTGTSQATAIVTGKRVKDLQTCDR